MAATRLWRRIRWRILAVLGWCLAGAFGTVAAIQRIELHDKHLYFQWGNAAEWAAAVGTTATFGALFYAALEWRAAQAERRDREADQARLIVTEHPDPDNFRDESVVVRNHSDAPVFDVQLYTHPRYLTTEVLSGGVERFLEEADPAEAYAPVLRPGAATTPPLEVTSPNYVDGPDGDRHYAHPFGFTAVAFTDSRNRRWWRFGINQPRLADEDWGAPATNGSTPGGGGSPRWVRRW
jgi:hypothetical protein